MKNVFSAVEKVPELAKGFSVAAEELAGVKKELPPNLLTVISPAMEKLSRHAGQRVDWRATKITETPTSKLTDPLRGLWDQARPTLHLRDISHGLLRDDVEAENQAFHPRRERPEEEADDDDEREGRMLPKPLPHENLSSWVVDLARIVDTSAPEAKTAWNGLRAFVSRFSDSARFKDLGASEQKALEAILAVLCGGSAKEAAHE